MKTKKRLAIITIIAAAILILFGLTGCNQQIIDLNYTYDKAICEIGNEIKEIKIKKWNDYDGEQLQIIDREGNIYLVSSFNCTLIKED